MMQTPVDRVAGYVTGQWCGAHHTVPAKTGRNLLHWSTYPGVRPFKGLAKHDMTGHIFGWFTVVGFYGNWDKWRQGGKARGRWLVRCVCGDYELRRARAIKNPNNQDDKCCNCRWHECHF